MKRIFIASPGITGTRFEAESDCKRFDGMYYKVQHPRGSHITPIAYCYQIEGKPEVNALLDRQIAEERELRDRHYKEVLELREKWGV